MNIYQAILLVLMFEGITLVGSWFINDGFKDVLNGVLAVNALAALVAAFVGAVVVLEHLWNYLGAL